MRKIVVFLIFIVVAIYSAFNLTSLKNVRPAWIFPGKTESQPAPPQSQTSSVIVNGQQQTLDLPENLSISVFAGDLGAPRFMAVRDEALFVSIPKQGRIVAFPNSHTSTTADQVVTVIDDLQYPHGLSFHGDYLYIAEENAITRITLNDSLKASSRETVVSSLPFGGSETAGRGHRTRTIGFDRENNMYLSVGSSCNVCEEEGRGVITRFNEDGGDAEIFGFGIRNAVGFVFHPQTDELWATENSRDLLGDEFPPDEIIIVRKGKHYGWPYCNGDRIPDPDFGEDKQEFCTVTQPPLVPLQAHSAPLGLRFIGGNLLVAYHGSWNRSIPTGYKIVAIDPETREVSDWITGWLVQGKAWGRPVDVIEGQNGDIFISDDFAGVIYRVYKTTSRK